MLSYYLVIFIISTITNEGIEELKNIILGSDKENET